MALRNPGFSQLMTQADIYCDLHRCESVDGWLSVFGVSAGLLDLVISLGALTLRLGYNRGVMTSYLGDELLSCVRQPFVKRACLE